MVVLLLSDTCGDEEMRSLQTGVQSACLEAWVCQPRADESVGHQAMSFPLHVVLFPCLMGKNVMCSIRNHAQHG